jgi:hypothetical protein
LILPRHSSLSTVTLASIVSLSKPLRKPKILKLPPLHPKVIARSFITMAPVPKQMSGILIEKLGGPEVLTWKEDLPVPELKEGEVLVKNEYVGVNYIET